MTTTTPHSEVLPEHTLTELVARADRVVQIAEALARERDAARGRPVPLPERRLRGLLLELHGFAARLDDFLRRLEDE